jgi:site-specific recombinase XerD
VNREDALHLARWSEFLVANGLSATTVRQYRYAMLRLLAEANVGIMGIEEQHIVAFLASLGKRAHSRQLYLRSFKSFYGWAEDRGFLPRESGKAPAPKSTD